MYKSVDFINNFIRIVSQIHFIWAIKTNEIFEQYDSEIFSG